MRLSQLARKLGVTHSDIINFVENLDDSVSFTAHSKIEGALLEEIKTKFDPTGEKFQEPSPAKEPSEESELNSTGNALSPIDTTPDVDPIGEETDDDEGDLNIAGEVDQDVLAESEVEGLAKESKIIVTEEAVISNEELDVNEADSENFESQIHVESQELPVQEDESLTSEQPAESESDLQIAADGDESESQFINTERYAEDDSAVIRAKLVKLEGIKVVGKIDLPPPPKPKIKDENEDAAESSPEKAKSYRGKKSRRNHKNRKPENLKQKQEREKRKIERERKAKEKKIKAKKKQHYIEKLEKAQGNKPIVAKTGKSQKRKAAANRQPMVQKSKNPVKRFWHWLNGKYDQY